MNSNMNLRIKTRVLHSPPPRFCTILDAHHHYIQYNKFFTSKFSKKCGYASHIASSNSHVASSFFNCIYNAILFFANLHSCWLSCTQCTCIGFHYLDNLPGLSISTCTYINYQEKQACYSHNFQLHNVSMYIHNTK
jgi:hypothetical protein